MSEIWAGTVVAGALGLGVGMRPSMIRIILAAVASMTIAGAQICLAPDESIWDVPLVTVGCFLAAMAIGSWFSRPVDRW